VKIGFRDSVEVLLEMERTDCLVTNTCYNISQSVKIKRLKVGPEYTVHRVECKQNCEKLVEELKAVSRDVAQVGKSSIWVTSRSCTPCSVISSSEAIVLGSESVSKDRIRYRLLLRSRGVMIKLMRELKDLNLDPVIVELEDAESLSLTQREEEILKYAYANGYFDIERGVSMTEIAEHFGIATSSLSDLLRRALKKSIRGYFVEKE
jgi:predicted DNA binding protein